MAKAKKTESAAKKKPAKAKEPAVEIAPVVDTVSAAQNAAKLLVAKVSTTATPASGGRESSAFKNLKDSLTNPASNTVAGFLDKSSGPGQKKIGNSGFGGKQVGRNQTFGADVNRSGVPRRTGGG